MGNKHFIKNNTMYTTPFAFQRIQIDNVGYLLFFFFQNNLSPLPNTLHVYNE